MNPVVYASVALALVAVVVAIVAVVVATRRSSSTTEAPAILQQIDTVRGELRELSDLFLVPQRRGAVGETLLAELLASWLPEGAYELQHGFSNGARVDAVVRLGAKLVPVDSKFPLEAMRRASPADEGQPSEVPADVRRALMKHIADIASRYINPAEGTMSFALMYIPSERVYVELFASGADALMRQALERNVVPVSPATLFLYLQTVAYGLRGLSIPERTQRLLESLAALRTDLDAFSRSFEIAGGHLRNLTRAFDEAGGKLERVARRVERLDEDRADG